MKLKSNQALKMLNNAIGKTPDDNWIHHSYCVGNSAAKIAESLGLDAEKAKALGYIHDIGKAVGKYEDHVMNGYKYLKKLGYDDEYANICLTHSYLNNDVNCTAGGIPKDIPFRTEFIKNHEYTIYEKIINLCDLMCTSVNMTLEKRIIEIMLRRGLHANTIYHIKEAQKLKSDIDEMLGFNVYNLFPDAINN